MHICGSERLSFLAELLLLLLALLGDLTKLFLLETDLFLLYLDSRVADCPYVASDLFLLTRSALH